MPALLHQRAAYAKHAPRRGRPGMVATKSPSGSSTGRCKQTTQHPHSEVLCALNVSRNSNRCSHSLSIFGGLGSDIQPSFKGRSHSSGKHAMQQQPSRAGLKPRQTPALCRINGKAAYHTAPAAWHITRLAGQHVHAAQQACKSIAIPTGHTPTRHTHRHQGALECTLKHPSWCKRRTACICSLQAC